MRATGPTATAPPSSGRLDKQTSAWSSCQAGGDAWPRCSDRWQATPERRTTWPSSTAACRPRHSRSIFDWRANPDDRRRVVGSDHARPANHETTVTRVSEAPIGRRVAVARALPTLDRTDASDSRPSVGRQAGRSLAMPSTDARSSALERQALHAWTGLSILHPATGERLDDRGPSPAGYPHHRRGALSRVRLGIGVGLGA